MPAWAFAGVLIATFAGMEGVAYLMHKHLMHGPLWFLHRSHHVPRTGRFERNDLFGVFFSLPSMALIYVGVRGHPLALAAGLGMTAYGLAYWLFHDVLVHRRVRLPLRAVGRYLQRIAYAHMVHHKTHTKDGAVSFGFLWAPELRGR